MKNRLMRICSVLLVFMFLFSGCQSHKDQKGSKSISLTQHVEQNSQDDMLQYTLSLPENWETTENDGYEILAISTAVNEDMFSNRIEALPYVLHIDHFLNSNYQIGTFDLDRDKLKAMYHGVFNGDEEPFKEHIYNHVNFLLNSYTLELFPESLPNHTDKQYITNYQCEIREGKSGKIAVATFDITFLDKDYQAVWCVREDIPYTAVGFDDGKAEVSSADIAFAVLDDLQVEELKAIN